MVRIVVPMAIQRRAAQAGLDSAGLSAHPLRAGLVTATTAGVAELDIAGQT